MCSSLFLVGTEAAQIFQGSPGTRSMIKQVKSFAAKPDDHIAEREN